MDKMDFFSVVFISFPEAILVTALGFMLAGISPWWRDLLAIGALQAAIAYVVRNLPVPFGLHSILQIILYTLNILLITRLPYRIILLASLLGLIFYCSVEAVAVPIMLRSTGISINDVLTHTPLRIFFFLPQAMVMLIFIGICKILNISLIDYSVHGQTGYLSRNNFLKNKKGDSIIKQNLFIYVVILLPLLLLVILIAAYSTSRSILSQEHVEIFIGLFGVMIIFLTVLSAAAVKKIGEYAEKDYEAKRAAENLKQIEQLIDSSRKQRHDFYHQVQTVYGLLESGSYERARDYMKRFFETVMKTRELIKTDDLTLSALLFAKIGLAEARNIDMEIDVECSLKELPVSPHEASSLLGNLIDNALDAVGNNGVEGRRVKVKIAFERGAYVIKLKNAGKPIDPETRESIFKPGFTTKEGHSGLGLSIVKDILNKYGGGIDVESDHEGTTFTVTIPLKK